MNSNRLFWFQYFLDPDQEHTIFLVDTLRTYFVNNKRLKETAAICHSHINGLKYRLKRIEEVGKLNLDDPEACFNLQLALKIRAMQKVFGA